MNRPEDIRARADNIRDIEAIVTTLRALAVARQREARAHLDPIRAHETAVGRALSVALAAARSEPPKAPAGHGLAIVVGAGQGFSGAFAERIAQAALDMAGGGDALMVVGGRTRGALGERGIAPAWFADAPSHALDVPALASRLSDALFERLGARPDAPVSILFANPEAASGPLVRRRMFPFDFARFTPPSGGPLLMSVPPARLVAALVEEYVFAALCEALMLGFAAENAARAAAMTRARSNVKRIAADLKVQFQQARQDQMTTEIIELASGARAGAT